MKLLEIMKGISYDKLNGSEELEVINLQYDSRAVNKDDMFFCVEGFNVDGHNYIQSAIDKGAAVIICSRQLKTELIKVGVTILKVEDTRKAMAIAAANFYNNSHKRLRLIGITGTNGKTTSTFMLKSILETAGFKVGIVGTIANYIGDRKLDSHRTTPEALELHKLFNDMVEEKVDYCVMEVSSHSLVLSRVYGLEFEEGIFTNLTQDHLDFHKTFENYFQAKVALFKSSKSSIINMEDEYGRRLFNEVNNQKITYGTRSELNVWADEVKLSSSGIKFELCSEESRAQVQLAMPGRFNLSNALCSAAACLNEGINIEVVAKGLNAILGVSGRCEVVAKNHLLDYNIILDYAHSPDSLKQILQTVREFTIGRLICVFGCGGDRDTTKRRIMGEIASNLSDMVIVTSDNPRSEEPMSIIDNIVSGINDSNYIVVENRKDAIKKAIEYAQGKDTILIAGKGHEDYQELKQGKIHFDEREVIEDILKDNKC